MRHKEELKLEDVRLLDSRDVAKLLRVSAETVNKWRQQKRGPRYVTLPSESGKRWLVRYRLKDIQAWQVQTLFDVDPLRL